MEQRDYILREIERLGSILAGIRDRILRRTTSLDEVRHGLQAAARSIGVDLEIAEKVTPETLLMLVTGGGSIEPTRCWFFAESLYLQGLQAGISGSREDGADLLVRARMLFQLLHEGGYKLVAVTEAGDRIAEIDATLASQPEPEAP